MRTVSDRRDDAVLSAEAAAFLSAVRTEQLRHIDELRRASACLAGASGRLPFVAVEQSLLTRQFLDAQRSIMVRCAERDARAGAGAACIVERDVHLEPDAAGAARVALAALLDEWWASEQRDGDAIVEGFGWLSDDEPASDPRPELPASARHDRSQNGPTCLPVDVVRALDGAEPNALAAVLEELVSSLSDDAFLRSASVRTEPDLVPPEARVDDRGATPWGKWADDLVIRSEPVGEPISSRVPGRRRARHGLKARRRVAAPVATASSVGAVVVHAVVPVVALTATLGLVMAWIG